MAWPIDSQLHQTYVNNIICSVLWHIYWPIFAFVTSIWSKQELFIFSLTDEIEEFFFKICHTLTLFSKKWIHITTVYIYWYRFNYISSVQPCYKDWFEYKSKISEKYEYTIFEKWGKHRIGNNHTKAAEFKGLSKLKYCKIHCQVFPAHMVLINSLAHGLQTMSERTMEVGKPFSIKKCDHKFAQNMYEFCIGLKRDFGLQWEQWSSVGGCGTMGH